MAPHVIYCGGCQLFICFIVVVIVVVVIVLQISAEWRSYSVNSNNLGHGLSPRETIRLSLGCRWTDFLLFIYLKEVKEQSTERAITYFL